MQKLTMAVFGLWLSCAAMAADLTTKDSWEQQNCLNEGGRVVNVSTRSSSPRVFEFCYFFGDQGMDTRTLYEGKMNPYGGPDANRAYRRTTMNNFSACLQNGGQTYSADREDGGWVDVCVFWDGSAIDDRALQNGVRSPWNQDLNRALGIF